MGCCTKIKEFDYKKNWICVTITAITVLALLIVLLVVILMFATDIFTPTETDAPYQREGTELTNTYRARHGAPPLEKDDELCKIAVKCARHNEKRGTIQHDCPYYETKSGERVGENLWAMPTHGKKPPGTKSSFAEMAIKGWYAEKKLYNFNNPPDSMDMNTGHFTAMVWKSATKFCIGVAISKRGAFVAGIYLPHPNGAGKFADNVGREKGSGGAPSPSAGNSGSNVIWVELPDTEAKQDSAIPTKKYVNQGENTRGHSTTGPNPNYDVNGGSGSGGGNNPAPVPSGSGSSENNVGGGGSGGSKK